uniref:Uncharacterized protein n=1 Tax=Oryza barthii TaxID=65489 RepID=A0A0D3H6K6_9ORYZ
MGERMRRAAHAMLFPFPCSGHINPTLKLAELLHSRRVPVTFVNTEHNHERLLRRRGAAWAGRVPVRGGAGQHGEAVPVVAEELRAMLVEVARRVASDGSSGVLPVTCVVLSGLVSFALDVAEELGVPAFVLWSTSACGFACTLRLRQLRQRGYTPLIRSKVRFVRRAITPSHVYDRYRHGCVCCHTCLHTWRVLYCMRWTKSFAFASPAMADESYLTNSYLDTPIDWIAGVPTVRLGDVCSFIRTFDPTSFALRVDEDEANSCARRRGSSLTRTFDDLESDVFDVLRDEFPRVYTIGPLGADRANNLVGGGAAGLSLWEEDAACMAWLDEQPTGSVLYVSFGSLT